MIKEPKANPYRAGTSLTRSKEARMEKYIKEKGWSSARSARMCDVAGQDIPSRLRDKKFLGNDFQIAMLLYKGWSPKKIHPAIPLDHILAFYGVDAYEMELHIRRRVEDKGIRSKATVMYKSINTWASKNPTRINHVDGTKIDLIKELDYSEKWWSDEVVALRERFRKANVK